jgi:hypothetical protein
MRRINTPIARRLLFLTILLGALFFVQPVQQTVYAATCCTDCDTNYTDCMNSCIDGRCQRICYLVLENCSSQCDSSC